MEAHFNPIDLSRQPAPVDWAGIGAAPAATVMIRAGHCGLGGEVVPDPGLAAHAEEAARAGLEAGIYLETHAQTATAARAAARKLLELARDHVLTGPVALYMADGHTGRAPLTPEENTAIAKAFLSTVADRGSHPVLYASPSFAQDRLDMKELRVYDCWLAPGAASAPVQTRSR